MRFARCGGAARAALPLFLLALGSAGYGAELRGRVLDPAGAPLAGASVRVEYSPDGRGPGRACDAEGTFRLPVARDGILIARCFGFEESRGAYVLADSAREIVLTLTLRVHRIAGVEISGMRRPARSDEVAVPVERIAGGSLNSMRVALPVLSDRLRQSPEVTTVGRDEYNAAPAVRGLARFRTVLVLDGARIHSDREIGPTAGFVDPATLEAVEVIRGAGSVLYGSDAIGGVVSLTSQDGAGASGPVWVENGFSTVNRGVRTAGGAAWSLREVRFGATIAHASAGDYALPGTPFPWTTEARRAANSGFERSTLRARAAWKGLEAASFYSMGRDIGRPSREVERFTIASEEHRIHSLSWNGAYGTTSLNMRGHVHPTRWSATVEEPRQGGTRFQERGYRSVDWGFLLTAIPRTGGAGPASVVLGLQTDARSGVSVDRRLEDRDSSGVPISSRLDRWIEDAAAGQAGAFAHGTLGGASRSRIIAGARLDRTWRRGPSRNGGSLVPTGQLGMVREIGSWSVSFNLASAYREPGVTELFFSVRRPAGYIEGNPGLEPERSYQLDVGAQAAAGPLHVKLTGFAMLVRDWILLEPKGAASDTLTYANASRASLHGGSLEIRPRETWRGLGGRAFVDAIAGSDRGGRPLADLHAPRARLEILWSRGPLMGQVGWRGALRNRGVGPGETPSAGYGLVDAGASVRVGTTRVSLGVENLLDQEAYERNDPVSYPSPARSFHLSVRVEP